MPGVTYLEMARAAIDEATSTLATRSGLRQTSRFLTEDQTGMHLKNINWGRPVVVNGRAQTVHIGLYPKEHGQIQFEIYTESENGEEDSEVHSQGVAKFRAFDNLPDREFSRFCASINQMYWNSNQCYDALKRIGIDYGSSNHGPESVLIGTNQVLAKLPLPFSILETQDQFFLHPSLLDSALLAIIALNTSNRQLAIDNRQLIFPISLETLEIIGECTASTWAWIRYSGTSTLGERVQKLNIDLYDDQGRICNRVKGLEVAPSEMEERIRITAVIEAFTISRNNGNPIL